MPVLNVISRDGSERAVEGKTGESVKDVLLDNGFDELLALCGGCLSCATCHVHVDPAYRGKLPPVSEDENDLLDSVTDRDEGSRLSCQLVFSDALDGITVRIGAED